MVIDFLNSHQLYSWIIVILFLNCFVIKFIVHRKILVKKITVYEFKTQNSVRVYLKEKCRKKFSWNNYCVWYNNGNIALRYNTVSEFFFHLTILYSKSEELITNKNILLIIYFLKRKILLLIYRIKMLIVTDYNKKKKLIHNTLKQNIIQIP